MFYAHTYPNDKTKTRWQTMKAHALQVAAQAKANAEAFGEGERAERAGLLHDLGKYGSLFQRRLEGLERGLDHWTVGAVCAKNAFADGQLALVIQGHHIGLQQGSAEALNQLSLEAVKQKGEARLTEPEPDDLSDKVLVKRLLADGVALRRTRGQSALQGQSAADMLDTRMLFSALVDADHLDTAEAMRPDDEEARPQTEGLDAARALAALERRLDELGGNSAIPATTRQLRADLMSACEAAAGQDDRLWTLTAPTGSGKTLAMLRFALMRAARLQAEGQPLRRIVVVLPFLSILDQTVDEYRRIFAAAGFGPHFVLEHHSLTGTQSAREQGDGQAQGEKVARLLTQNWDAPIVITTSVQLLESLHSNHPSTCRKLHRLAGSIILLDEVQTIPAEFAVPTLKALARLTHEKYGSVVVMATATQPAFDTLSAQVHEQGQNDGWHPREMAPTELQLFSRAKRVGAQWDIAQPTPWGAVRDWITDEKQVLCIVNMRKHALELTQSLSGTAGLRHLSTYLCAAHRRKVLADIRADLDAGRAVRVVATQCVEAGVDLDFPTVLRALAPLDAVAQAAGRCNRHAKLPSGLLRVFLPEHAERERLYPTDDYKRAAQLVGVMAAERGGQLPIDDPDLFHEFFRRLWQMDSKSLIDRKKCLEDAIFRQDYPAVAQLYRLIPQNTVNVVVPYGEGAALIDEARRGGIDRYWMRRAQPYVVSVFRTPSGIMPDHLEPVNFKPRGGPPQPAPDWFLAFEGVYDTEMYGYQPDGGGADPFSGMF